MDHGRNSKKIVQGIKANMVMMYATFMASNFIFRISELR